MMVKVIANISGVLLLSGCTISYPVWLGDKGVSQMCEESGTYEFTHNQMTREFAVHLVDENGIRLACGYGRDAAACIVNGYDIYVSPGVICPKQMAHELSHGFGLHYVDRPSREHDHG
ncbi:MAG: hypothetical protein ABJL54_13950 [Halioglobus sp.]